MTPFEPSDRNADQPSGLITRNLLKTQTAEFFVSINITSGVKKISRFSGSERLR